MIISDIKEFFSFLKPSNIKGWFNVENLFLNYFWLCTISALIKLTLDKDWLITILFPLVLYAIFIKKYKPKRLNTIDVFWYIEIIWIIITWMVNSYPNKGILIFKCMTQEVAFMLAYCITRYSKKDYLKIIIQKAYKPLVITCVIGIYCFFFEPSWYARRTVGMADQIYGTVKDRDTVLELWRLKSIFASTYTLAYFCAITLIYEFYMMFTSNIDWLDNKKYRILLMLLLIVTSLFCMMRAPIAGVIGGFISAYYYSIKYIRGGNATKYIVVGGIFVCFAAVLLISYMDQSLVDFMFSKVDAFTNSDSNFIEDRLFLQMQSLTLFGEGFGRYSNYANNFGMPILPDGEYMKIIAEQGFVGLSIILCLFISGLLKGLKHFRHLYLEFSILCMLVICMIGADPLSIYDKHCFIYWIALGQISRYYVKERSI